MNVLVTGATGFLGSQLAVILDGTKNVDLTVVARRPVKGHARVVEVSGLDASTNWLNALTGQQVVIHAAARAHIMKDEVLDPLAEYHKVNVEGTLNLAQQAAAAGVKRFIFISSVKVNGESTTGRLAFTENMPAQPGDAYGISKYEAEAGLKQIAKNSGMEVVIIRPPLVYGPSVKANFLSLLKLSASLIPLPFACINNRRSMIYVGNLVDFIIKCIDHPAAANQTFIVSDGEDVSLRTLIALMRKSMGKPAWLLPVPVFIFKLVGKITSRSAVVDRLVGDLQVDSTKARTLLNWVPPYTLEQGIAATVADFKNKGK